MDPNAGRFIMPDQMDSYRKKLVSRGHPIPKLPTLAIGEVVEIKGVKFRVTRIKVDGKLGLKMVKDPNWEP